MRTERFGDYDLVEDDEINLFYYPEGIIEFCHICGVRQPIVWQATPPLWKRVRGLPGENGVLCPRCFTEKAMKKGMFVVWEPKVEKLDLTWENPVRNLKLSLYPMKDQH